jgi:hypothetical protein
MIEALGRDCHSPDCAISDLQDERNLKPGHQSGQVLKCPPLCQLTDAMRNTMVIVVEDSISAFAKKQGHFWGRGCKKVCTRRDPQYMLLEDFLYRALFARMTCTMS